MIKVLHITPWYAPAWSSGGTAVAATNLCEALVKLDCDVTVFTTLDSGGGNFLAKNSFNKIRKGVKVFYFNCGIFKSRFRSAALSLEMFIKIFNNANSFDLIHIHSTRHIYGIATLIICKIINKPYIVTPHGSLMKYWMNEIGYPFFKKLYSKLIDKYVLRNASKIHFLCKYEYESSKKFSFNNNFFLLPNGIKIIEEPIQNEKNENHLKLLSVARIHPQKNLLELIKAVSLFKKDEVSLDIFGSVYDKDYYKLCISYINKNCKKKIRLKKPLPKKEILKIYKNYDLFCMPSIVEGISMALIEAASNGLPALITRGVANYKEILFDKSGILTKRDYQDIYKNILEIYQNREKLIEMKKNAYLSSQKRYDISKVSKELLKTYKTIYFKN